jgi:sugar lactone lactonase YvrE
MSEIRQARPLALPDSDALRYLPEGPIPLGEGLISWVGIQHGSDAAHGSLNLLDLRSEHNQSFELPGRPGFAFPCEHEHTFVVGCERSLGLFDVSTGVWQTFCEGIDARVENTIINDGVVFQDNLIFGTKDLQFATKKAGLYLYRGADRRLIQLRDDQICSNGKSMLRDRDGSWKLLDIDSPTRTIVSYPIDLSAGSLGEPTIVLDFQGDPAVPDGAILTPDERGVIVSMFRGEIAEFGETRWYDLASGELRCTWRTPLSPQNTCPALVRVNGKLKLVITTAVEHMSAEARAKCIHAGRIFIADVDFDDPGGELTSRYPIP